jgi:hypothetical protein
MFLAATVVMCLSFNGLPSPPWAKCEVIESPLVQAVGTQDSFGHQCRLAVADNLHRWVAAHRAPGWWVASVNCAPIFPKGMG